MSCLTYQVGHCIPTAQLSEEERQETELTLQVLGTETAQRKEAQNPHLTETGIVMMMERPVQKVCVFPTLFFLCPVGVELCVDKGTQETVRKAPYKTNGGGRACAWRASLRVYSESEEICQGTDP